MSGMIEEEEVVVSRESIGPRQNQPLKVSIVDAKKGKTKEEQIEDTISRWYSGGTGDGGVEVTSSWVSCSASSASRAEGERFEGSPRSPSRSSSPKETSGSSQSVVEENPKSRVGMDASSLRARDIQNLKSRGLEWLDDNSQSSCFHCNNAFSVVNRRHHCRLCGRIFCANCCPPNKEVPFPAILNHNYPVRACCLCYNMESLDAHTETILGIFMLSTGEVVSSSADNTLRIWEVVWEIDDTSGGQCIATLCGHTGAVTGGCELSEKKIVSVSSDKTMKIWEMEDTKKGGLVVTCLATLRCTDPLNCVVVHEGKILCGTAGGHILVCRLSASNQTIEVISTLKGHEGPVRTLQLHDDGYLLSASDDGCIKFWDLGSDACLATLSGHEGAVTSLALIPATQGCFVSGGEDHTLRIWKVVVSEGEDGKLVGTPKFLASLSGHSEGVTSVTIAKGQYIVSASMDSSIVMWSLETGKVVAKFLGHVGGVTSIFALPSGLVVSGAVDKSMRVWKYTPPQSK